jgi:hypothetical protein
MANNVIDLNEYRKKKTEPKEELRFDNQPQQNLVQTTQPIDNKFDRAAHNKRVMESFKIQRKNPTPPPPPRGDKTSE